jgi:hypothetical protein
MLLVLLLKVKCTRGVDRTGANVRPFWNSTLRSWRSGCDLAFWVLFLLLTPFLLRPSIYVWSM